MAAALAVALAACTTETKVISAAPAPPGASDVPVEEDPGSTVDGGKVSTPDGLLFGATCTGNIDCRTGLSCIKYPGAAHGYCAADCSGGVCPKAEGVCINLGICAPSCADGCPADTNCAEGHCIPSCKNRKDICGSRATCTSTEKISICIGDGPTDPPVETCKPPTITPTSGVSQAKTIAATTATEKGTLCDWQNGRLGGYGCTTKCDGGVSTTNKADQAACKAAMKPTCTVTVAQVEACVVAMSANRCDIAGALAGACKPLLDTPGCM